MDHRPPRSAPTRRTRTLLPTSLAILGVATAAFVVRPSPAATARGSSSSDRVTPPGAEVDRSTSSKTALGEADGVIPDGVTVSVFDTSMPAVAKLDHDLLDALRRAARDAARDGVRVWVNSGWRSPAYQEQLFQDAVVKYGSQKAAARWVATPETSAHVSGDAVDIGPPTAEAWLSRHGAAYGLCPIYRNEPWHYERRPDAVADGCPRMYADPTEDPRMQS